MARLHDLEKTIGQERKLVNEKCDQSLSSSSENIWSIEDIYSLVGGETKYNKLMEWASYNLSDNEIDKFNIQEGINFIQLNFVAVRSGIEFSEIVGKAT